MNIGMPANSLTFINKVKQEELNILYNISDFFIFPSRKEPLGLVGIESIAAGTPVIGSNVGGIKEYINDNNGFLFNPNKPEELSSLLLDLSLNHIEGKRFKNKLLKKLEEHDATTVKKFI